MFRTLRRIGYLTAVVLGAVFVLVAPTAGAQTPSTTPTSGYGPSGPSITADPYEVHAGDTTTCTLTGFVPGETVTVTIDGQTVGTVVADSNGNATLACKVPNLSSGVKSVVGTGSTGDTASTTIKVIAELPTTTPKQSSGPLAFTGADVWPLTLFGGLAVLVGGLVVLGSRKRATSRR